jgi:Tat protein translocase TatB subunit
VFDNLGWLEIAFVVLLALFILGPDRLPNAVRDGARMLRKLRGMARNATQDFREQLGPDVELEDLHPKRLLRRHLLSEAEEEELRQPFRQALGDDDYRKVLRRMRGQAGLDPSKGDVDDDEFDVSFLNSKHPMFGLEPGDEDAGSSGAADGSRRARRSNANGKATNGKPAHQFDPDAT